MEEEAMSFLNFLVNIGNIREKYWSNQSMLSNSKKVKVIWENNCFENLNSEFHQLNKQNKQTDIWQLQLQLIKL